jgi:alpha-galactosidase
MPPKICLVTLIVLQTAAAGFIRAQTPVNAPPDFSSAIRTPPAPNTPRINGPRVYGERPGHAFLYHLPVTGDRPLTFSAEGLPDGLVLDKSTGNITGTVRQAGTFPVKFTAQNALGQGSRTISLVIGPTNSGRPGRCRTNPC